MTLNVGWQTVDRRTTNGIPKTVTTNDNLDGSVASITYPSGRTITYTSTQAPPDGAGRPKQAVDSANQINYVTNASYTAFGSVSGLTNGASITVSNTYNLRMQPWHLNASNSQGGQILALTYDFHQGSDNGNVYQIVNGRDANRTQNFTYDPLNRIAEAWTSGPNWGERFTIDPWGNLTNRDPIPGKTYYEPLSAAQATSNNQLTGYGYDASGDMTQNQSVTYSYDAEGHLMSTAGVNYTYDGDGNRVTKSNGTLYWGGGPLAESDASGNIQREYVFFDGKRVARLDVPTNAQHYYFSNHLSSTSIVTNASGIAPFDEDIDYYPYGGEVTGSAENIPQNYKFNGKERDTESGLDNFGARFDASSLGRFMTPDWAEKPTAVPYAHFGNPQSLNLYSYAQNNPTTLGDPDGHTPWGFGGWGDSGCASNSEQCQKNQQLAIKEAFDNNVAAQQTAAQDNPTPQSLRDQIPAVTRAAMAMAISDSDSARGDDPTGGFHEESGVAGQVSGGAWIVSRDKPGPYANPDVVDHAHTTGEAAHQEIANLIVNPQVWFHVHPSGQTATHNFKPEPSLKDKTEAVPGRINIVFGARNHKVYFYNSGGVIGKPMKLSVFLGQ